MSEHRVNAPQSEAEKWRDRFIVLLLFVVVIAVGIWLDAHGHHFPPYDPCGAWC